MNNLCNYLNRLLGYIWRPEGWLKEVLKEMFFRVQIVGKGFDKFEFSEGWYHKRSWTLEQETDFKEWLIKYYIKNSKILFGIDYKKSGEFKKYWDKKISLEADIFILNYGWRIK